MAYELPGFKMTLTAGEDLSSMQYHFVKISANDTVVMATELTDIPCGVLQNTPISGAAAEIVVTGLTKLRACAAGLAVAALVGCDGDGHGVAVDPDGVADNYYCGQVVHSAGASEIATALINCATPVIQAGS